MKRYLRPPGAKKDFIRKCIRCGKCYQVCPYKTIRLAFLEFGIHNLYTPFIIPREVPCYLCMKCPPVCPSGALDRSLTEKTKVKMGIAKIDEKKCLAYLGTLCRSCYQNCPIFNEAITIDDELKPKVNKDKCVGCGICENVCPVEDAAIIVSGEKDD